MSLTNFGMASILRQWTWRVYVTDTGKLSPVKITSIFQKMWTSEPGKNSYLYTIETLYRIWVKSISLFTSISDSRRNFRLLLPMPPRSFSRDLLLLSRYVYSYSVFSSHHLLYTAQNKRIGHRLTSESYFTKSWNICAWMLTQMIFLMTTKS